MVGSKGTLSIGTAYCIGAFALAAWAAPLSYADDDLRLAMTERFTGVVLASLPASRNVALRDVGAVADGTPPSSAYRRILRRIAAVRHNWVPMSGTPRLAAMTPITPNGVGSVRKHATMPASIAQARYALTASVYRTGQQ